MIIATATVTASLLARIAAIDAELAGIEAERVRKEDEARQAAAAAASSIVEIDLARLLADDLTDEELNAPTYDHARAARLAELGAERDALLATPGNAEIARRRAADVRLFRSKWIDSPDLHYVLTGARLEPARRRPFEFEALDALIATSLPAALLPRLALALEPRRLRLALLSGRGLGGLAAELRMDLDVLGLVDVEVDGREQHALCLGWALQAMTADAGLREMLASMIAQTDAETRVGALAVLERLNALICPDPERQRGVLGCYGNACMAVLGETFGFEVSPTIDYGDYGW